MRQQRQLRKGRLPALMRWCVECQQADGNEVLAATKPAGIGSLLKNFGVQRKIILGDAKNPENEGEKENGGEKARFASRNACFAPLRPKAIGFFRGLLNEASLARWENGLDKTAVPPFVRPELRIWQGHCNAASPPSRCKPGCAAHPRR